MIIIIESLGLIKMGVNEYLENVQERSVIGQIDAEKLIMLLGTVHILQKVLFIA